MPALDLARAAIRRHLGGPGFAWFVGRDRPAPRRLRRRPRLDYGRDDKAAPVALLPAALRDRLGATSPIVGLTDWAAGKQYWRHGRGRQLLQRGGHVPVPGTWYAGIQELVDQVAPEPHRGDWVFETADGRRLVLRVQDGVARVLAYYRRH